MAQLSKYFHSSLYAFTNDARAAVIDQFYAHAAVKHNVAVKCYYVDTNDFKHMFAIESPQYLASDADAALGDILARFIQQELDSAQREEREPTIQRFSESEFSSIDAFDDAYTAPVQPEETPTTTSHVVVINKAEGKRIKFFHLHQLPANLLQRTLAPHNARFENAFNRGWTCRAVRWDTMEGDKFNGRTGAQHKTLHSGEALSIPSFAEFFDQRPAGEVVEDVPDDTGDHRGGVQPVERWLAGVGSSQQLGDPDEGQAMPKETKKLIQNDQPFRQHGRARVVKGAQVQLDQSVSSSEAGDARFGTFTKPLSGKAKDTASVISDSSSEASGSTAKPSSFANLLRKDGSGPADAPRQRRPSCDWSAVKTAQPVDRPSTLQSDSQEPMASSLGDVISPQPSNITIPPISAQETFPNYGGKFAAMDKIGLNGAAGSTAEWVDSNHQQQPQLRPNKAVKARGTTTTTSSMRSGSETVAVSRSDQGPGDKLSQSGPPSMAPSPSVAVSLGSSSMSHETHKTPGWVGKVVMPNPPQDHRGARLVDIQNHSQFPALPGNVLQPPRKNEAFRSETPPVYVGTPTEQDDLIDLGEEESLLETTPEQMAQVQVPAGFTTPIMPTSVEGNLRPAGPSDGENALPFERVRTLPPELYQKRNTMGQKARQDKRKKQTKGSASKVELPLPLPPPPPKVKVQTEAPAVRQHQRAEQRSSAHVPPNSDNAQEIPSSILKSDSHFGKAINRELQAIGSNDLQDELLYDEQKSLILSGRIGTILVRTTEKDMQQTTLDARSVEKKLNELSSDLKTDFTPRVTASEADAKTILELTGEDARLCTTATTMELYVRDATGSRLKVSVPSQKHVKISKPTKAIAEALAHYPLHVYDARYELVRENDEHKPTSIDAINAFVASMTTFGKPPSFKAFLQPGTFIIERVLAKQCFQRDLDGLTFEVSQSWDLHIEHVDSKAYNVRAICKTKEEMEEESRVWWEASYSTSDLTKAAEVERRVHEMVPAIDSVGLGNVGPYEESGEMDKKQTDGLQDEWFW